MTYKTLKGKIIEIPDEEIEQLMDTLDLTEEEALDTWLSDNDYKENAEVERLTKKAKENKVTNSIHQAKSDKPRAKRTIDRKPDTEKENIIQVLAAALGSVENITDVRIVNVGKLITFKKGEDIYKLDLIRQRRKWISVSFNNNVCLSNRRSDMLFSNANMFYIWWNKIISMAKDMERNRRCRMYLYWTYIWIFFILVNIPNNTIAYSITLVRWDKKRGI